jgi:hypothetical protein
MILLLRPLEALHSYWRDSSPEAHIAVGGAGFAAWASRIDWAAALAFACLAASTIGGTGLQLYRQWRIIQIELKELQAAAAREVEAKGASQK